MRSVLLLLIGLTFGVSAHADNLLSLYQRALLASPELSGSQYALDIARAQEDQSFGKLLPQAVLRGNYSGNNLKYETKSGDQYPGKSAGVTMRQPLFDLQSYLLMKSQKSRTEQGEENLLAAHQQLISDLVTRYVDALEAADKSVIIQDELSSTEKQLARVKAMNERQMALITDLYELQARVETLRTALIESNNDAKIALEKLRELTGDAVTGIQPVRLDSTEPPPDGSVDTWIDQAHRINPELNGLKRAVDSADQSISAYQAGHLPRVELQASGNYSNTAYNNQQTPAYTVGTIGVDMTMPLYEGGITSARVREAEGRKGLNNSQLEQKLREVEKITRAAYLDMTSSPARSLATDRQLEANEQAEAAMEKGYELGVVTIVDLLNAQKQLSEARKVQRQSRYRYFKARSNLLQQAGRLDVEELAKLNSWLASDSTVASAIAQSEVKATDKPVTVSKSADKTATSDVETPVINIKKPAKPVVNTVAAPAPAPAPVPVTVPAPVPQTVSKPADKPVTNTVTTPVAAPVSQPIAQPIVNAVPPPAIEPLTKPSTNAAANPMIESAVSNRPKVSEGDCRFVHADYRNPKYKHCLEFTPPSKQQ